MMSAYRARPEIVSTRMIAPSHFSRASVPRHLRQYENGVETVLSAEPALQSPLDRCAALSGRAGGLHAGSDGERQVENRWILRERFFTPRLRFKTYDELNAWLLDSASPMRKRIVIKKTLINDLGGLRGREPNALLIAASSMGSTKRTLQSRRLAWCASTTTDIRSTQRIGRPSSPA